MRHRPTYDGPPDRLKHVFEHYSVTPFDNREFAEAVSSGIGYVYLMSCNDLVKVGCASHPRQRLNAFQIGNPYKLEIIKEYPTRNPRKDEQRLHKRLSSYHVRGEWYKLPGKLAVRLLMLDTLDNIR